MIEFMKHIPTSVSVTILFITGNYWLLLTTTTYDFLVNNYKQALEILKGESTLKKSNFEITDTGIFGVWLEEWNGGVWPCHMPIEKISTGLINLYPKW